jgi:hypothetical protein
MNKGTAVARLKITLEDVEPRVMRQIDVPLTIRLDRLHQVIQAAMPWTNSHLWAMEAGGAKWGDGTLDLDDTLSAAKSTLLGVIEDVGSRSLTYIYDFGDSWEHTIRIEDIRDPVPGQLYPALVKAEGRCPPEDIGGAPGYESYLEAVADPHHEEHDWMLECYGEPENTNDPEIDTINELLARLAKRWAPRPRKKDS